MEMIQFHPTTLPSTGVLISEGVRGEGGILYNAEGERFMFERGYANNAGELASRDVVSRAELTEVNEGRGIEDEYVHLDMRHLGEERIVDRLENILHLAEDFEGVDGLEEPMPVKPGQHYAMGGIETDEFGRTCVDGLYAVGECACASVHGANRLGGNALPELIVFGKRAGAHAAGDGPEEGRIPVGRTSDTEVGSVDPPVEPGEPWSDADAVADGGTGDGPASSAVGSVVERAVERERTRVERLLERETDTGHAEIRAAVQRTMTENVNVFRERAGVVGGGVDRGAPRARYRDVSVSDPSETFNTDLIQTVETRNLLDIAEVITLGALAREEFRGAHWRAEHQERRDDAWLKHTMVSWDGGSPTLWYRDVVLEGEGGVYEPKTRSY
jgi:succinate dehydrogenase / fumarate reductase flavoprotein subunit